MKFLPTQILIAESGKILIDNRFKYLKYPDALLQMDIEKIERVKFEYTIRNVGELIRAKIKWGVDVNSTIHDLSIKEKFKARVVKAKKIRGQYLWLNTVTYPFDFSMDLPIDDHELTAYFFTIVYIDYRWEIYDINVTFNSKHHENDIWI